MLSRALSTEDKLLRSAIEQARKGNHDSAAALAAATGDPLRVKIVKWLSLTQQLRGVDFVEVAAFIEANPEWPQISVMQRLAEAGLGLDPSPTLPDEAILAWFQTGPASLFSPSTSNGAASYAAALLRQGQAEEAGEIIRDLWIHKDLDNEKSEALFLQQFGDHIGPDDQMARLDRQLLQRKEFAALRQAKRLGSGYVALTKARMSLAYGRHGVDYALRAVPPELQGDPGLIYERARWRMRRGRYDGVVELIDPPRPDWPNPERWWQIREWTARKALRDGSPELAYRIASSHGLTSGVGFAEGEWLAGWIALKNLERPEAAYEHFVQLHDGVSSPISKSRGAYWAAVAAAALGRSDQAKLWYDRAAIHGTAFYGQLAARRLGLTAAARLQPQSAPDKSRLEEFQNAELVAVVRLLHRLGERKLERTFLNHMVARTEDATELRMIADLATQLDRQELAVRTAKQARSKGVLLTEHLFPQLELPREPGPEAALVLALIRQESAFDSKAISRAGARGLMQLMPSTARLVARNTGEVYSAYWLTSDPDYNVRLGRAYLKSMLQRFDGAYVLALAAYNAGPHRVDRWLVTNGDPRTAAIDTVDWIEQIPFGETRNYVQRVLESLSVYRLAHDASRSNGIWKASATAF
jgi:soluble lytic murein transglycosylase